MRLLERDNHLARLADHFGRAAQGHGSCVLLFGEAGVGKTTLIRQFLDALPERTPRLVAGCEALSAPRPMGPFVDLADHWPPTIAASLREGRMYPGLYAELLAQLARAPSPKVLVLEDLHWADAGTLDCVRYLARRIAGSGTLVVMSFRTDDVDTDHPLRTTLADLPAADSERIEVPCLSQDAVEVLARCAGRSPAGLFEATGGNAFFVTEVLCGQAGSVPHSVCDAVLARLARLSPAARALAELVSVAPSAMERSLVEALVPDAGPLLDECIDKRVLRGADARVAFRHELARQAVVHSLPSSRAARLHAQVFEALRASSPPATNLQRMVHHAELAGLGDAVLAIAPQAARTAADMSAHREAAGLYSHALKYADGLGPAERADLLEAAAREFKLIGANDEFMQATRQALALRRQAQDPLRVGMNLRLLASELCYAQGLRTEGENAITEAVEYLEKLPASTELALAYATLSQMQSSCSDFDASIRSGDKAVALAESLSDQACLVRTLHAAAAARMFVSDDPKARAQLQRALSLALELGLDDAAAQLYCALQVITLIYRRHAEALEITEQGIAYCEARDLDARLLYLVENRALSQIELGRWAQADLSIARCMELPGMTAVTRSSLQFLRARLDAKRGEPAAQDYWRRLRAAPDALPLAYRMPAIAAACAEASWLQGELEPAQRVATLGAQAAVAQGDARLLGPLLVWLHRLGAPLPEHALRIAPEHASELAGCAGDAAAHWSAHGCVYERALALMHGTQAQVREALDVLTDLGATPAAEIARSRLRALGVRGLQRGPQPRTRDDPDGLTKREREVHALLCEGLSNAAIAARLHRSERTVECHVASALAKLGARSRTELLVRAPRTRAAASASI